MRILVVGDVHGSKGDWKRVNRQAEKLDAEVIFCAGDVAYGWGDEGGFETFPRMRPVWFIDGNHENFDELESQAGSLSGSVPVALADDLTYVPRGARWEWDGVRFMGFGGASSIDKDSRLFYETQMDRKLWWEQELITKEQVDSVPVARDVDILITHDLPDKLFKRWRTSPEWVISDNSYKQDSISTSQRLLLDRVLDLAGHPPIHLHGHWHVPHRTQTELTLSIGLADCSGPGCAWLIDTTELQSDYDQVYTAKIPRSE